MQSHISPSPSEQNVRNLEKFVSELAQLSAAAARVTQLVFPSVHFGKNQYRPRSGNCEHLNLETSKK